MKNGARFVVTTHWGTFSLDEGSYQDYLAGKLWICWTPVKPPEQRASLDYITSHVTDRAITLREQADRVGILATLHQLRIHEALVPYTARLAELSIDEMSLTVRSSNGLKRANIHTFGRLKEILEIENGLLNIRNIGQKSIKEIKQLFFEEYIARLIIVQSIKPIHLLEDENEDLRCIRRLKTKRNKKAKEAALANTQDHTAVTDAMSSKNADDSTCVECTPAEILEFQSCEKQRQLPIHNLTRKDLLWVVMGEDTCKDEKHHVMAIRANFEFYNGTNQLITIRRCAHCKQYQIDFEQFEHVWKERGLPKLEIIYIGADGNIDGNYWKDRSVFSEHGYSVSQEKGLTTIQRQQKLKWIIDHGIMSKYDTIRFLRSRISINGMKPENWLARSKWAEDLRYVQSL